MNIDIVYNTMLEKLEATNNLAIITGLEAASAGAATGGEGVSSTGKYLFDLRKGHPLVYNLIEEEIKEYLKYCKQNGIIIR